MKKTKPKIELTVAEAEAILEIKGGADVYAYGLAKTLREMERANRSDGLFEIGKSQMYTGDGTDRMPYFGAIATPAGVRLALKAIGAR